MKKWVIRLGVFWLGDPRNLEAAIRDADDERVRVWAREARFGIQAWKRLWNQLDTWVISEMSSLAPCLF